VIREEIRDLLDVAVDVAWRGGRATLAHYQTGIAAELKSDTSPVTAADRDAERVMRELIARHYPHDAILGEEEGATHGSGNRRWVLDPIDGTRTFLRGVPFYGVLVAVEADEEPVLGVMHFPALAETVYAARGLGCWWNGRRAVVSDVTKLEHALVLTTDVENIERCRDRRDWDRLRARAALCRTWGDCYGYALVATGRAEAMLDPIVAHWDTAPLAPIIEEAGGVLTDWSGANGPRGGSAVATNAALAQQVRHLLGNHE
jgi:histidinol-phosphatase